MTTNTIRNLIKLLKDIQVFLLGGLGMMCLVIVIGALSGIKSIMLMGVILLLGILGTMLMIRITMIFLRVKIKDKKIKMCITKSINE